MKTRKLLAIALVAMMGTLSIVGCQKADASSDTIKIGGS